MRNVIVSTKYVERVKRIKSHMEGNGLYLKTGGQNGQKTVSVRETELRQRGISEVKFCVTM